jgi:archaellum component FlaC
MQLRLIILLTFVRLCVSKPFTRSQFRSSSFIDDDYEVPIRNQGTKDPSFPSVFKVVIQCIGAGSFAFFTLSTFKIILRNLRLGRNSTSFNFVPSINETVGTLGELKGEISELWSAILGIHKRQVELQQILKVSEERLNASTENFDNIHLQLQKIEADVQELRESFSTIKNDYRNSNDFKAVFANEIEKIKNKFTDQSDIIQDFKSSFIEPKFELLQMEISEKIEKFMKSTRHMIADLKKKRGKK